MTKSLLILILTLGLGSGLAAQTNYVIGAQDVLTITVFGEADLSAKYTVEQDGTFTFPLIGRVKPGGLTLRAFEQDLKKELADGFLKNPQVTVAVETYRSQRILVMGEVRAPGEYLMTGDTTLLSALARAGSPTPAAGREAVIIRAARHSKGARSDDPETEILHIDLADLQAGDLTLNIPLQEGDTINVPKAQSVFVSGQVKAPGAYAIDRGTTVLQVLALAGGATNRGAEGRATILRMVNGTQKEIKTKLTDIVEPGDTIKVPERRF
jgi:polysaccharide export outer membrane protein